jgi:hypothetical protein
MSELASRGITVTMFKKQYPRIYRNIIRTYGGRENIFDIQAALELWLRGDLPPKCDICGCTLSITKKYRTKQIKSRCAAHVNTTNQLTVGDLRGALPQHIRISDTKLPQKFSPTTRIELTCDRHGMYHQLASFIVSGGGCQKCYNENRQARISVSEWRTRSAAKHGNKYDYSNSKFLSISDDVQIGCPEHGEFIQNAGVHMHGHGCKKCANSTISKKLLLTTEEFITRARNKHGELYEYTNASYVDSRTPVNIRCKKHGDFEQIAYYHLYGNGCPVCGAEQTTYKSAAEYEIIDFLKSSGITNIEHSWHNLGFELDIYLPDYKLAIEYNGVYWHSSNAKSDDAVKASMHLNKTQVCENNGISLLHILDLEWTDPVKQSIWKSTILHKLGKTKSKIYARNCKIVLVNSKMATQFFNQNHLQGAAASHVNIGLAHNGELVAVGSFARSRFSREKTSYEIIRFASLINSSVIGGFQKIIKEFEKTHTGSLISYANRRWSQGNVYKQSGFVLDSASNPCYYYTNCKELWHRSVFQKHKLVNMLPVFDESMTEVENMYANKYRRIWDCGHLKYRKEL